MKQLCYLLIFFNLIQLNLKYHLLVCNGNLFLILCIFFKAGFHYESGKDHCLFVLLIFLLCLALASILSAERSIKETKNVLFHACSGNGPLSLTNIFLLCCAVVKIQVVGLETVFTN